MPERPAAKRATALGARPVVRYFSESSYDLTHSNPRAGARRVTMGSHYGHGYRSDYGIGGGYGEPQRRGWRADRPSDPLDVIWRYSKTFIPELAKRQQSEKPLRDWFTMDHNSNVLIERKDDSVESSVATQYQKIYGASDRRGTRDDEFDGRDDARDRQRERPRQRGGYEPPRVVVVRSHGAPASYGNASNPPPPMEAPPPDPPPPPPTQPMPPHRHERVANPPPPRSMGGGAAWDRGRAPNPAAAPFYPSAGARPSAAPMGRLSYAAAGGSASMASAAPMASMASKTAPMASRASKTAPTASTAPSYESRGGAHNPPPPSSHRAATYVRPSRYDVYDTDRDDDSDTDPEEDRRRRESLARERDPARRPRDAPGDSLGASEEARRRRSLSESLSRHDSLGERSSQGNKPVVSRAPPKAAGTATQAASRVSGILNAIGGPSRLSAPKPIIPVGAAAAPRVKDTSFEERARALADEKKRKAAEATAAEATAAEAERAAVKRARLAKEAKEATRVVPKPEPETIEVSDEDGPDDKPAVIVDDDDSDIDAVSDVDEDDKARVEEDEEARREKIRAKKKLKQEKKLKKKMSDASEKAVEKSVEDRHASPVEPLGGVVPDDAVGIIHNAKYPAYHLFARDVYVQKLFRSAESRSANATPDLCIRRFRVKASDAEPTEVKFENTDATGNASTKSVLFLRSWLALFRWAAREWGRDSHHLKLFYDAYGGGKKQYSDVMDGKD